MADTSRFTIICPCCEATLNIDANTGAILSHEEKQKPLASFEGLVKDLDKQKQTREQLFAQEMSSMKDRERLLEEKFKEAMKRAEKDKDKVYKNPLDLDWIPTLRCTRTCAPSSICSAAKTIWSPSKPKSIPGSNWLRSTGV